MSPFFRVVGRPRSRARSLARASKAHDLDAGLGARDACEAQCGAAEEGAERQLRAAGVASAGAGARWARVRSCGLLGKKKEGSKFGGGGRTLGANMSFCWKHGKRGKLEPESNWALETLENPVVEFGDILNNLIRSPCFYEPWGPTKSVWYILARASPNGTCRFILNFVPSKRHWVCLKIEEPPKIVSLLVSFQSQPVPPQNNSRVWARLGAQNSECVLEVVRQLVRPTEKWLGVLV